MKFIKDLIQFVIPKDVKYGVIYHNGHKEVKGLNKNQADILSKRHNGVIFYYNKR